jgi:integration host factor subunit alpha
MTTEQGAPTRPVALPSLQTPTLTKAELAELLFERLGLNKRESKDMVEAFFELVHATRVATSSFRASATSTSGARHPGQGATRAPARPSRSRLAM